MKNVSNTITNLQHAAIKAVNSAFAIKQLSETNFRQNGKFYNIYLQIRQTLFNELENNMNEPIADSSLYFSEVKTVMDMAGGTLLEELFERLVIRHIPDEDRTSIQDSEVWSKIYKPYFEKASFSSQLKETVVKTRHDEFHFDRSIRNGVLHCFEPISFQLTTNDTIRRKAYTWSGRLQELESTVEPIHVYLLAAMPEDQKMQELLKDKFANKHIGNAIIGLVDEKHDEQVIKKVKILMEVHEE